MSVVRKPTRYRPTWGTQSVQNRSQNRPTDPQSGSEIDPETTEIVSKSLLGGPSGGPWGAPGILCETVAFSIPPDGKATFRTPKGPKGAQRAPKAIYRPDPAPPKTPLGRFFTPPKTRNENKHEVTFGGPWGPMCVFLAEKRLSPKWPFGLPRCSRRGLRGPRRPIWPLFEILGGP